MRNKLFFTAGIVGMLSGVASGATDGAEIDYGRDWNPYVTLRGGWLFGGKTKYNYHWVGHDAAVFPAADEEKSVGSSKNFGSAWSGSGEFGVSCFDERVFVELELGYFTGKATFELPGGADKMIFPAEFGNTFGVCNVTLRHYFGERGFWYGGVGAGIARVSMTADAVVNPDGPNPMEMGCGAKAWSFLGQGFTGFGLCLNDNWQLTVGYRLRYLSEKVTWLFGDADVVGVKMKQDLNHAAEVGVTYRF